MNFLNPEDIWKYIDDAHFMEVLNLVLAGLACYNFKNHVASDIPTENKFLPTEHFSTKGHLEKLNRWTVENQMELNISKTKYMIINFCDSVKFSTRLSTNDLLLEQVSEARILGVIISSDLTWHSNTNSLIKRAYARMTMLRRLYEFNVTKRKLIHIYILFIRSVTEQSSVVWSSSITEDEVNALERTQKVALRIIYRGEYISYLNALSLSKLPTLVQRRESLLLAFAKKISVNPKVSHMLPKNVPNPSLRRQEKYKVDQARTSRFANSPVNVMARMLNEKYSYINTAIE